jgi:hypothetical protein
MTQKEQALLAGEDVLLLLLTAYCAAVKIALRRIDERKEMPQGQKLK